MNNTQSTIGLSVLEAGWILQKTEAHVRGMLRRGALQYAVAGRKIDPESIADQLESSFDLMLLRLLVERQLVAPKPVKRYGPPAPLLAGLQPLMLRSPALVHDSRSGRSSVVPRLADALDNSDLASADDEASERTERSLRAVISFIT